MDSGDEWAQRVRDLFDEFGDQEWDRLVLDARGRVNAEIHRRFLRRYVPEGSRVLEIGAGPGRFTIELARMHCDVVVGDISPVQLALNEAHVREAGFESCIAQRVELNICDLSSLLESEFDAVVAFGGPLSYAFEEAEHALRELLRVTRPGGVVVASVMALVGSLRFFLPTVPTYVADGRFEALADVIATGDNRLDGGHPCWMFRWSEIQAMVGRSASRMLGASASNFLSCGDQETLVALEADPEVWPVFLDWEEAMCSEPGALDGGTHLLFAVAPH